MMRSFSLLHGTVTPNVPRFVRCHNETSPKATKTAKENAPVMTSGALFLQRFATSRLP
jgi:hypothetical protein